jgi:hypothetical protein
MLLSLERFLVGAFDIPCSGATRAFRKSQGRTGRPGSKNMRKREWGFPRNSGNPVVSTEDNPDGDTGRPTPGPTPATRHGGGSEIGAFPWYRQAKETKCGGMDGRKSQCLDSTVEAGEQSPERTPGREARHRDHGLVVGTYAGYLEIR